jgi:multiple sugar transport system permease protein
MIAGNKARMVTCRVLVTIIMGVFALFAIFPFVWMISTAFKYEVNVLDFPFRLIPDPVNTNNFVRVWTERNFPQYYLNTLFVAVTAITLDLAMNTTAAFAFSKLKFRGKEAIFVIYLAVMMLPIHVTILPRFMLFSHLGLVNTHAALILPYGFSAFGVFLMRNFFEAVPDEIIEAARIDGAGYFRTYAYIGLPLMTGAIMTQVLLQFSFVWNDYFQPLIFLTTDNMLTLTVGLARLQESLSTNYALIMAGTVISIVPVFIVFIIAQKYIIQSFASVGIKG